MNDGAIKHLYLCLTLYNVHKKPSNVGHLHCLSFRPLVTLQFYAQNDVVYTPKLQFIPEL